MVKQKKTKIAGSLNYLKYLITASTIVNSIYLVFEATRILLYQINGEFEVSNYIKWQYNLPWQTVYFIPGNK